MKALFIALLAGLLMVLPPVAWAGETGTGFGGAYVGLSAGAVLGSAGYATDPNCPVSDGVFCEAAPSVNAQNGPPVAASGTGTFSPLGLTGSVQGGYTVQADQLVFGAEGDFGFMNLGSSATASGTFPLVFAGDSYTLTESMSTNWLATLRGRVGTVVAPHLLLFATGGVALTDFSFTSTYRDNAVGGGFPGGTGTGNWTGIKTGLTIGAGAEWLIKDNWSLKAEYLYADFGHVSFDVPLSNTPAFTQTMRVDASLRTHIARVGFNFRY